MMVVKGEPYRTNLAGTMQLATMRAVKQTWGFKWAHVFDYINKIDADEPLLGLLDEDEFLAWMWAWMRNAGSGITRDEMFELTPDDIEFRPNDEPVIDVDDSETADADGEASPTAAPTPSSSSSKGSGRGSAGKAARKQAGKKQPASSGTT